MTMRKHYAIVDTLLESMDVCDTSRYHESTASVRWRSVHAARRVARTLLLSAVALASVIALAAFTLH
jgi:hypothetical protein